MQETTNSQLEVKKDKINYKKIFTLVLVISLITNVFFVMKLLNPNMVITGAAILVDPEINQNLADNVESPTYILHYSGLREKIQQEIESRNASKNIGLFIQDIKTGSWNGYNEKAGFAPASLLKIPIMMAILKKVDRAEISLDEKIVLKAEDIDSGYQTNYEGKEGQEFTVEQLLRSMITESDNTAKNALARQLFAFEVDEVFKHIGIPNPYLKENRNKTLSPRDYSRFFKSLYYSTFLSPKSSQFALEIATHTQVENLIPEGVPDKVKVAHKFGIYDEKSLHDCGIVYHPKNPYLICIMTKNMDSTKSAELIRSVSRHTYEFVDQK